MIAYSSLFLLPVSALLTANHAFLNFRSVLVTFSPELASALDFISKKIRD
jgi:hypothetical protein